MRLKNVRNIDHRQAAAVEGAFFAATAPKGAFASWIDKTKIGAVAVKVVLCTVIEIFFTAIAPKGASAPRVGKTKIGAVAFQVVLCSIIAV